MYEQLRTCAHEHLLPTRSQKRPIRIGISESRPPTSLEKVVRRGIDLV